MSAFWFLAPIRFRVSKDPSLHWDPKSVNIACIGLFGSLALSVQVPKDHIFTPNLYQNHYYPNPKYLIVGYMDPLGRV